MKRTTERERKEILKSLRKAIREARGWVRRIGSDARIFYDHETKRFCCAVGTEGDPIGCWKVYIISCDYGNQKLKIADLMEEVLESTNDKLKDFLDENLDI